MPAEGGEYEWIKSLSDSQYRIYVARILEEVLAHVKEGEARISSLERFRYAAAGGIGVITAVVVPVFVKVVAK